MTALRHPNVVLFMAASTKAPKMCIVMEFMTLGSLFDVRLPPPPFPSWCKVHVLVLDRVVLVDRGDDFFFGCDPNFSSAAAA
jgi:hypothetical protein